MRQMRQLFDVCHMRHGQNMFRRIGHPFVDWHWSPDTFPRRDIHFFRTPRFHPARLPRPLLFPESGIMMRLNFMNLSNTLGKWEKTIFVQYIWQWTSENELESYSISHQILAHLLCTTPNALTPMQNTAKIANKTIYWKQKKIKLITNRFHRRYIPNSLTLKFILALLNRRPQNTEYSNRVEYSTYWIMSTAKSQQTNISAEYHSHRFYINKMNWQRSKFLFLLLSISLHFSVIRNKTHSIGRIYFYNTNCRANANP